MRKRTQSREFALQILYEKDMTGMKIEEVLHDFWETSSGSTAFTTDKGSKPVHRAKKNPDVKFYAERLAKGAAQNLGEIDRVIENFAENWTIERMSYVDRNILRIAVFEFLYTEEIPIKVAINEAVELAKRYGEEDSSKFVNGILDKIAKKESKKKTA